MTPQAPSLQLTVKNEPSATASLRRGVDRIAAESGLSQAAAFELKVAATEALTNALKNAPAGYEVELVIAASGDAVEIEVSDRNPFRPRVRSEAPTEAEGGRGLPLMLALVDEIEFAAGGTGTRVRMRKRVAGAGEGDVSF